MNFSQTDSYRLFPATMGARLGVLLFSFVVMLLIVGALGAISASLPISSRNSFLLTSVLQNVLMFILPAFIAALLCSNSAKRYLELEENRSLRPFIGVFLLWILSVPAMNALVEWNENITLPDSMSALYATLRAWEDAAATTTELILHDTSVWGLVSGLLVVGLLTGFAEETFFRGGIQRALTSGGWNHHIAIWLTAFVFSAIHFQFFGFVPRLIMGAAFGYLYWSSRSLWVPVFAHALNNSSVVLAEWLRVRGDIQIKIDSVGTVGEYSWAIELASLVLTALFIAFMWTPFFRPTQHDNNIDINGRIEIDGKD